MAKKMAKKNGKKNFFIGFSHFIHKKILPTTKNFFFALEP